MTGFPDGATVAWTGAGGVKRRGVVLGANQGFCIVRDTEGVVRTMFPDRLREVVLAPRDRQRLGLDPEEAS